MTELEIIKIIEQGQNTNAPAEITLKLIKEYCNNLIEQKDKYLCENQ